MYDELDTNNDKSVFTQAPLLTLTNPSPQPRFCSCISSQRNNLLVLRTNSCTRLGSFLVQLRIPKPVPSIFETSRGGWQRPEFG